MIMAMIGCIEVAVLVGVYLTLHLKQTHVISTNMTHIATSTIDLMVVRFNAVTFLNIRNAAIFSVLGRLLSVTEFASVLQLPNNANSNQVEIWRFNPAIATDQIPAFNAFCAAEVTSTCYLSQLAPGSAISATSKLVPVTLDRSVYYPNLYLYPESSQHSVIQQFQGLDLGSFKFGQIELDQWNAAPTTIQNSTVTTRLNLVVPSQQPLSYGIAIGTKSYSSKNSTDFLGYASVVLRLETVINNALSDSKLPRNYVQMAIFDVTNDTYTGNRQLNISLLFRDNVKCFDHVWYADDIMKFDRRQTFTFLDRNYVLYFVFTGLYMDNLKDLKVIIIPCSIAAAMLLFNIIMFLLYRARLTRRELLDGKRANHILSYCNHEIRNPLNIIKGTVDYTLATLSDKPVSLEPCITDLTIVSRTCSFLEHIVNDILVIQKLENDDLLIDQHPCRVSAIIDDLVECVAQKMDENKNVKLIVECDRSIALNIDSFRLKQMLLNLLSNAIKYTHKGHIIIRAELDENQNALVSVIDTGIGISDENKHVIFTEHEHDDKLNLGRHGNLGLGLHLVRILAERMSWAVGFESTFGVGSTFWIKMPARQRVRASFILANCDIERQQRILSHSI